MSSIVELIFSALGTEASAAAVQKISGALGQLAPAAAAAKTAAASLGDSLATQSAIFRDKLQVSLDGTTKQLLGFGAAALSVRAVYSNLAGAIADGSEFIQLSRRTGENVRDLVVLRQAFENAGLGAGYIGTAANLLDRVLSGTAANGKKTAEVFGELGISMAQMRGLDFTEQLQVLGAAFARLPDQATRAAVSMQLFGRYAGGQMLQLLADTDAFKRAEEQAGRLGDRMKQDAPAFNDVSMRLSVIKLRMEEMSVSAAEQLLPALRNIASAFSGMNLSGLGTMLGQVAPTAIGGLLGIKAIDSLDRALINTADKFAGSLAGSIAGVAGEFTGVLATALPFGLAAAIGVNIVTGILAAYEDGKVQALLHRQHAIDAEVTPFSKQEQGVGSKQDVATALAATSARIQELVEQQKAMTQALAGDTNESFHGKKISDRNAALSRTSSEAEQLAQLNAEIAELRGVLAGLSNPAAMSKVIADNQLAALKQSLEPLVANLPRLREEAADSAYKGMNPNQQLAYNQSQRSSLQGQLAATPAGLNKDETDAYQLPIKKQLSDLDDKDLEIRKKVTEEGKKQAELEEKRAIYALETQREVAEAGGNTAVAQSLKEQIAMKQALFSMDGLDLRLAKERMSAEHQIWVEEQAQKAAKQQVEEQKRALNDQIAAIRANLASLEGDQSKTEANKWASRKAEIEAEIAAYKAAAQADRVLAAAARAKGQPVVAGQYDQEADDASNKAGDAQKKGAQLGPDPSSYAAQIQQAMNNIANSMKTTAQEVGKAWQNMAETMTSSLANALYSMDERTKTFKQAATSVYVAVAESFMHSASQMAADWIMKNMIMAGAQRAFLALGITQTAAATAATTAIHATGEVAQTGATASGSGARTAIRFGEMIAHGIQVAIGTALHVAGEIARTAVTLVQAGIRVAAGIAEAMVGVIQAAAGAMAAMASIPYVGPILAIAAMGAILAAGTALVKGAPHGFEAGGWTGGREGQVAGVVHGEEFVLSAPAVRAAGGPGNVAAVHQALLNPGRAAAGAVASRAAQRFSPDNLHVYLHKSAYLSGIRADMEGIAHEVYDKRSRQS